MRVPPGFSVNEMVAIYARNPSVEFAEPNFLGTSADSPNDPVYSTNQAPYLNKIQASAAWDISTGNPSVVVAIIDTGAVYTHEDLSGQVILGHDYIDNDEDPLDGQGHGTFVAGIIGASTNNSKGIAGIARGSKLLIIRDADNTGAFSYFNLAAAITYAADHGARIINMSQGGTSPSATVTSAVNYAFGKNIVLIAAAGNNGNGTPVMYPAAIPNVLAVGATDSSDALWSGSATGSQVGVVAPGVSVASTSKSGGYATGTGTSFASPQVAGLAALIMAKNPGLTNQQIVDIIKGTADPVGGQTGFSTSFGSGRINALRAVQSAASGGAVPATPTPVPPTATSAFTAAPVTSTSTTTRTSTISATATTTRTTTATVSSTATRTATLTIIPTSTAVPPPTPVGATAVISGVSTPNTPTSTTTATTTITSTATTSPSATAGATNSPSPSATFTQAPFTPTFTPTQVIVKSGNTAGPTVTPGGPPTVAIPTSTGLALPTATVPKIQLTPLPTDVPTGGAPTVVPPAPTSAPVGGSTSSLLQDAFSGPNGTPLNAHPMNVGSGWTTTGGTWTIQSNAAQDPSGSTSWALANAGQPDVVANVDIRVPNASRYLAGTAVRIADAQNGWFAVIQRDGGTPYLALYEMTGGASTKRASANLPDTATNSTVTLTVTTSGPTITLASSTGQSVSYSSATGTQSATQHGLYGFTNAGYAPAGFQNFAVANASAATPPAAATPTVAAPTAAPTSPPTATAVSTPSGPGSLLQDSFTGASGASLATHAMDVGPGWTVLGGGVWTIQSNAVRAPSASNSAWVVSESAQSDVVLSVDLLVPNTNAYLGGAALRVADNNNGWFTVIQRDGGGTPYLAIYEVASGTSNKRATVNLPAATTNSTVTLTVTATGSAISAAVSTGQSVSYTSATSSQTATRHGLFAFTAASYAPMTMENFLVTIAAAQASQISPPVPTPPASTPVLSSATPQVTPTVNLANARIVGPGGFGTITQAVAASAAGGTIAIHAGTYPEEVTIAKTLTLVAFGDGPVWIDAECTRPTGITIARANDVVIRGLGVKRSNLIGIMMSEGSARATIDGNTVQDYNCSAGTTLNGDQVNAGIGSYYGGAGHRVTNNTITRRVEVPGAPQGLGDGIWFKSSDSSPSGGGHYIAGNTILGGFDGIGGENEADIHGSFDKNTVIENNTISFCGDDGIQSEGGNVNVTVRNNVIRECGAGISLAATLVGPLYVTGNTITGTSEGILGNWMCFKVGNDNLRAGVTYITNNSCQSGTGIQQTNEGIGSYIVSNNTFNVVAYVYEFKEIPASQSSFNGDCLFSSDPGGRFVKWNQNQVNFAGFRTMGFEASGRVGPC